MGFIVNKATREKIWVKTALMSPSGGGKTYSALRLATGMLEELKKIGAEKNGRILLVNTESSRGRYYANEFEYDIIDMVSPHHPDRYVEVIDFAVSENYPILILDSTSPEWDGKGGCLELHQKAGGTYQAWAKVTPLHDKFIEKLADSPIHIIATMRGKDQYEMEKNDAGKTTVKKLAVGAKQRDGFEYEFTCTFLIDQKTSMATVQKDNTHLFENESDGKLNEGQGIKLIQWANSGEGYTPPVRNSVPASQPATATEVAPTVEVEELRKSVIVLCRDLGGQDNVELMTVLKKFEPKGDPRKIKEESQLKELLTALNELKTQKEQVS